MPNKFAVLHHLFRKNITNSGEKTALVFEEEKLSYLELNKAANKVAHALIHNKIEPNSRVALLLENSLEYVICDVGIIYAGATKVPLNYMLAEKEIAYILNDSGAEILIVDEDSFDKIQKISAIIPNVKLIVGVSNSDFLPDGFMSWEDFQGKQPETVVEVHVKPTDMAGIMYTGGTTGRPKGVVHDQKNVINYIFTHITELEIQHDEKILLHSPLPHSAGLVLQAGLLKGAENWIEKKFNPSIVLDRISKNKITFTFLVPTMIYRLLDQAEKNKDDYSSLRTVMYGAAPIDVERLKQGLSIFGSVFVQIYGQTEAPNLITKLRKEDHRLDAQNRLNSCGQSVTMSFVKIVDENGKEVPKGKEGEIIASTPYNMVEYFRNPETTEATLIGGWVYTGDIGKMDEDGYVYLLDRKKDMIISGGLNIYSVEVENVLLKHPGVKMVAVIGVPHSDWGEQVVAIIVTNEGYTLSKEEVLKHCEDLTKYKRPKVVYFVDSLHLTPYGKIDKKKIKSSFLLKNEKSFN
ncbi:class I adenylate-forming enzyme family protein [Oceanobacillus sp. CF4.6]|uniref:class I adenylate-forming enzyme family protein n=1 Tax=Oceanobacillus sp. CF4.6 TaxID=3373080 RepID=UPI003EE52D7B